MTWLNTETGKFFQYINGRNPPFRNFSIPGADIDVSTFDKGKTEIAVFYLFHKIQQI